MIVIVCTEDMHNQEGIEHGAEDGRNLSDY
ncbi:hypothetical protein HNR77_003549 [Paenibacillus sp. JGP012]|nr:hypothetical protein [Paenibacillus sp. JGP012]